MCIRDRESPELDRAQGDDRDQRVALRVLQHHQPLGHALGPRGAHVVGTGVAGVMMRHTRSAMLQTLGADYVRTAKSRISMMPSQKCGTESPDSARRLSATSTMVPFRPAS